MMVSGLVESLAWQESVVYWPDNVGKTFFLLILLHISH